MYGWKTYILLQRYVPHIFHPPCPCSYQCLTGDSSDPISLPSHHSPPTLLEMSAMTEIDMPIRVIGYIPSKLAKPLKSLNNILKHQKPKAPPTEHAVTSLPLPHQLTCTSQLSPSRWKTMAHLANLDDGESMTGCLPGSIFTDYHIQVSMVIQVLGAIQVACTNAQSLHHLNRGPL